MYICKIPFDLELIDTDANTEYEVDFSNIAFDGVSLENQISTAFLYFRNTGFKFKPDFSKCSNIQISAIIKEYLKTEYRVSNNYLETIWLILLLRAIGIKNINDSILNEQQLEYIEQENANLIHEFLIFIKSLLLFGLELFQETAAVVKETNAIRTNEKPFGDNLYSILSNKDFQDVFNHIAATDNIETKHYNMYFQISNEELIKLIENFDMFTLTYGVVQYLYEQ